MLQPMTQGDCQGVGSIGGRQSLELAEDPDSVLDFGLGGPAVARHGLLDLGRSVLEDAELSHSRHQHQRAPSLSELEGTGGVTTIEGLLDGHDPGQELLDDLREGLRNDENTLSEVLAGGGFDDATLEVAKRRRPKGLAMALGRHFEDAVPDIARTGIDAEDAKGTHDVQIPSGSVFLEDLVGDGGVAEDILDIVEVVEATPELSNLDGDVTLQRNGGLWFG